VGFSVPVGVSQFLWATMGCFSGGDSRSVGIAAVMMATIPYSSRLGEIVFLGTQKLTWRLAVALVWGLGALLC